MEEAEPRQEHFLCWGGGCYPAWDHLPPCFQEARLGAFSW